MKNVNQSLARLPRYTAPNLTHVNLSKEPVTAILELGCNENPRGPSPTVMSALTNCGNTLNRYPDSDGLRLRTNLAERLGVSMHQITLGNGSSGVLDLITRVALSPKSETIVDEYCFTLYPFLIYTAHGEMVTVSAKNWSIDFSAFLSAVTLNTRLIFLTNPSNPLGTWIAQDSLAAFLEAVPSSVWVVLDEAYYEYAQQPDFPDAVRLCQQYPNLVFTRTFSKVYGLSGLRIGYGVSSESMAELLNRARPPFNVNSMALVAAEAALDDVDYVSECLEINELGRCYLYTEFSRMGLDYLHSLGNFITFNCGRNAEQINSNLLQRGIRVRTLTNYNLPNHLRVTIGLPSENKKFITTLEQVLRSST